MINEAIRTKLIDVAWDIVKSNHDTKINNTAALAKHLADTYHELYRHIKDVPDFQDDIWGFTSRKN